MIKIMAMTPLGRLAISDHAMAAVEEMTALNNAFGTLKRQAGISTPNWDALEVNMPSAQDFALRTERRF